MAYAQTAPPIRNDWRREEVEALFRRPLLDLVFEAAAVHRAYHDPRYVQLSSLLSIKTGGCPEDCGYCPQSVHHPTRMDSEPLMDVDKVLAEAENAREHGATRFCMGAAWRTPPSEGRFKQVLDMVEGVRAMGMETCATLGMVTGDQATRLKSAGLDYYNHNLDTDPEYYGEIITTRTYDDRLNTSDAVRAAGLSVCCGGIIGMGEGLSERAGLLHTLATMSVHPESVPINALVRVEGTPLADQPELSGLDFVRTIAAARILMPASQVRLSAGRLALSDEAHALAFLAGANSIFTGEKLLTTPNPGEDRDMALLGRLGLTSKVEAPTPM